MSAPPGLKLDTPAGARVIYHGTRDEQVKWGGCDDPRGKLTEGQTYIVHQMEVHSWHSTVSLNGITGRWPAGAFHRA